jgi:hypothetical protein
LIRRYSSLLFDTRTFFVFRVRRLRVAFEWKFPDLWVGAFFARSRHRPAWEVWICLVPCFPLHFVLDDAPARCRACGGGPCDGLGAFTVEDSAYSAMRFHSGVCTSCYRDVDDCRCDADDEEANGA